MKAGDGASNDVASKDRGGIGDSVSDEAKRIVAKGWELSSVLLICL